MSDTEWQVYDPTTKTIRDCTPDELFDLAEKVRATDPVTGEYADLTTAEAYDWPTELPEPRVVTAPSEVTATAAAPAAQAAVAARLTQ